MSESEGLSSEAQMRGWIGYRGRVRGLLRILSGDVDPRFIEQIHAATGVSVSDARGTARSVYWGNRKAQRRVADTILHNAYEANTTYNAVHLDPLTGLLNYSSLNGRLETYFSHPQRRYNDRLTDESGQPLHGQVGVFFIDGDHIKILNDTIGHDNADGGIVAIARAIDGSLRPADLKVRRSGDEFLVVLLGVAYQEFERVGERLKSVLTEGVSFEFNNREGNRQSAVVKATIEGLHASDVVSAAEVFTMIREVDDLVNMQKAQRYQQIPRARERPSHDAPNLVQ